MHEVPIGTEVVPLRHPWRWVAASLVLVGAVSGVVSLWTNELIGWSTVGQYLFSRPILDGLRTTLILTGSAMGIGVVIGVIAAMMRMSVNPVLKVSAGAYLWFFRGTPLLVQLIFWYNLSAIYPTISLGIPFGPTFIEGDANQLIGLWTAAVLGLALNEGAYVSEVFRGGLLSVGSGQKAAAQALGMTNAQRFRRVIAPQAVRVVVPPLGNRVITMLKVTSLVSVIGVAELLYSAQLIYSLNYQTVPLLIVVSIWYLTVTTLLTIGQHYLERAYGRGYAEEQ